MEESPEIALTEEELKLGFSGQTLSYPASGFDLSGLVGGGSAVIERAVAIELDGANRIRRRRNGSGYLHERLSGGAWTAVASFESAADVAASDAYVDYLRRLADQGAGGLQEGVTDLE